MIVLHFVVRLLGGSMVGVNGDLLQEGLCHTMGDPGLLHPEPLPFGRPLLTCTSAGDKQTLKNRSGSVTVGSLGPKGNQS